MRKLFYVVSVAIVVPPALVAAVLMLWWFTTTNTASVNISNHSKEILDNVTITVPGRSESFQFVTIGDYGTGFAADPSLTFHVHMAFDTPDGHHVLTGRTHMLPFGDHIVDVVVDAHYQLSVSAKPTFMYR